MGPRLGQLWVLLALYFMLLQPTSKLKSTAAHIVEKWEKEDRINFLAGKMVRIEGNMIFLASRRKLGSFYLTFHSCTLSSNT